MNTRVLNNQPSSQYGPTRLDGVKHIFFNSESKNRGSRRKMINILNCAEIKDQEIKAMKMPEYKDNGSSERVFTIKC